MQATSNPQTVYLKDYTVPEYLIDEVDLNFELDEECTQVTTKLTLRRNPQSLQQHESLTLMGENLTLISITLDDHELLPEYYQQAPESLTIFTVPQQQPFIVTIQNQINPKANTALEGLYLSGSMLCTQCEAEGFRKITYFLDRPDVMSRFRTTLSADKDKYPVLLSNGNKVEHGELSGNRHWVTWEDPFKKPSYLFALVAGQLECLEDRFTTMSGRDISLQIFVEAYDLDKCGHAMQSLKNAMQWDEQAYGREYDLDLYMLVAVGHFNMGAMENKGLNIFNTKFVLARPDTATDTDYEYIEGVIGHEYFHNWTGNRITCRDWFQLSLKEGFTVFRDQQFTGDRTSVAVKRIEDVNTLRIRQFPEDAGPLAHPIRPEAYIEINNFYTSTVYQKGAEVVRMIQTIVGAAGFRKGCDLYFERHDGQAVTCEDFVNAIEAANQVDLSQFRHWYSQAGTPVISVEQDYDQANQRLTLTLTQHCPATPGQVSKQPFHIPVKFGLLDSETGQALPIHLPGELESPVETVLHLKAPEQMFVFEQVSVKPVISALRGFSAPVKLVLPRTLEELGFLLRYDTDAFNRWEAGQQLVCDIIMQMIQQYPTEQSSAIHPVMLDAFQHILSQEPQDLSYFTLLLGLPSEIYLAEQMSVIDVDGIHRAREQLAVSLARQLESELVDLYQRNHRDESDQFDAGAVGRRRIKNVCLGYLGKLNKSYFQQLAVLQFESAKNMTDQIAALSVIVNNEHPEKQRCLAAFYQQWQDEALVIDKWFALQASSSLTGTIDSVTALLEHPAFDIKNPNRVRSLVGAFSQFNLLNFHASTGQGYQFLADQVIALNEINPQVASRMLGGLTQWRRYDSNRQHLMKTQLQRIMRTPNISRDVYEVLSKSIA